MPARFDLARNCVKASTDMPCIRADWLGKPVETELLAVVEELREGIEAELPMEEPERDVVTDPAGRLAGWLGSAVVFC